MLSPQDPRSTAFQLLICAFRKGNQRNLVQYVTATVFEVELEGLNSFLQLRMKHGWLRQGSDSDGSIIRAPCARPRTADSFQTRAK